MREDIKAQWVAALRSGEYAQAEGALKKGDNSYCCLGVLCDLAVKAGAIPEPITFGGSNWHYGIGDYTSSSTLPPAVRAWAGIPGRNPLVEIRGEGFDTDLFDDSSRPSLASMNDAGVSFAQIADLIEEQF